MNSRAYQGYPSTSINHSRSRHFAHPDSRQFSIRLQDQPSVVPCELSSQRHGFRSTPTVPVNGDAGAALLLCRQHSVPVRVEQAQDFPTRLLAAMIFVHPDLEVRRVIVAEPVRYLDFIMDCVVVPNEPADEIVPRDQ